MEQISIKEEGDSSDEEQSFFSPSPTTKKELEMSKDEDDAFGSSEKVTTSERLMKALGKAIDLKLCDIAEAVEKIE